MSNKRLMTNIRMGRFIVGVAEDGLILNEYDYDLNAAILCEDPESLLADAKKDHPDLGLDVINRFVRKFDRSRQSMEKTRDACGERWEVQAALRAKKQAEEEG